MSRESSLLRPNDLVLFQGDSITNAFRMPQEMSSAYQMGAGYAMMCAARIQADYPRDNIRFLNRGVSGDRIFDVHRRWQTDCLDLRPTVISLLIGINDTNPDLTDDRANASSFQQVYDQLLQETITALPEVRIIVLEPFGLEVGEVDQARIARLQTLQHAARLTATKHDCEFVELQHHFDHLTCQLIEVML